MFPHVLVENAEEHEYLVRLEKSLEFFKNVFGKTFRPVYFSNLSELSDFRFADDFILSYDFHNASYAMLCKQWDRAVLAKIEAIYKINIDTTDILLKNLFEQCLHGQNTRIN